MTEIDQPDTLDIRAYCPECGTPAAYNPAKGLGHEPIIQLHCGECGQIGVGHDIDSAWRDAGGKDE